MASFRHQHIITSVFSGIAFVFLLNFVFIYYSIGDRIWIFYNSDSIYLPYLYQDLIMKQGKFSDWIFSGTPYFFPDMFIYFILAAISHHLRLAIILYGMVQFILYYWLIIAIGKKILPKTTISLLHFSVLLSLFLLSQGYLQQETLVMGLFSQSHFGTALMFLLGLLLVLNTFSSNSIWNYFFLFIVCFLTVFSDILYLTQFFAPAIMSLCFMFLLSKHRSATLIYMKNILVISFSCISSYIIYRSKLLPFHLDSYTSDVKRIHLFDLISAAKKISYNLSIFNQNNSVILMMLGLYIGLAVHYIIKELLRKNLNDTEYSTAFSFTIIFLFASIITGCLSLLFFDNNLMIDNFVGLRHCIPFIIFPVFLGIPLFLTRYTRLGDFISTYYIYIIIWMLSSAYIMSPKSSISNIINFYPQSTACLDFYADKYHLKNGVSYFFWETRSNTFLSKKNLNIVNINTDLSSGPIPRLYFNTLHDFKNKDFNFIIIDSEQKSNFFLASNIQSFKEKFGAPSFEFTCPAWNNTKNTVLVYQDRILNKDWAYDLFEKLLLKKHLK